MLLPPLLLLFRKATHNFVPVRSPAGRAARWPSWTRVSAAPGREHSGRSRVVFDITISRDRCCGGRRSAGRTPMSRDAEGSLKPRNVGVRRAHPDLRLVGGRAFALYPPSHSAISPARPLTPKRW